MGPKLDDMTLGTLGPTEFFGELSLLPIEGGWSHRRTAMVVQNAMLHTLSKIDVQSVADRFPQLRGGGSARWCRWDGQGRRLKHPNPTLPATSAGQFAIPTGGRGIRARHLHMDAVC